MPDRPIRIAERYPLVQDPPFRLDGTRTLLFVLACDPARLDALLARTFAWAAPEVEIERLGQHCILAITDVARAEGADPALGWFAYREATFFVPVWGRRAGVPFAALHVPFIYPDQGLAVAAGREIYGLPKKPARIDVPSDADLWSGAQPISASTLAAQAFDGSQWTEQTLFTISSTPQPIVPALADSLLDAIELAIGALPGALGPIGRLLQQDLVQLKQVPDVTPGGVPARVAGRAVTRVAAPVRALSSVRVADASKVRIDLADLASEPIRDVLGLAASVVPVVAASMTMDFSFDAGEVWLERPEIPTPAGPKKKVLILGGGMGALATAHALSDTDAKRAAYDVRVLVQGHLLGGKGANVRNPARAQRIEEHGLHVIFGFYHNFLRLMRSVYADAARAPTIEPSTFEEAFEPEWRIVFHDGASSWEVVFPRTPATYGAGPSTLQDQLLAAAAFAQAAGGAAITGLLGGLLPGAGNTVERQALAFVLTLVKAIADDVVVGGKTWDQLDAQDFRAWMKSHAIPGFPDLEHSALMQVPYDGIFAYEGPDQSAPELAAGVAARGLLKLVTDYEKAPYWTMTAGMGETVFAPMYEVLRARGVKLEFFAKVKEVRMVGGRVAEVAYGRQATVTAGPFAYSPLAMIGQVPCWQHEPDAAQLTAPVPIAGKDPYSDAVHDQVGADLVLHDGVDFDWVVCALPAPVTAHVLRGHAGHPVLSRIAGVPTVATLHLQTWFRQDLHLLGWHWTSRVLGAFRQPLNSMLGEDPLLSIEQWPAAARPRGLLYMSGPFGGGWSTDSEDPAARAIAESAAYAEAEAFARHELGRLLPVAVDPGTGQLDVTRLHAPWTPADPMRDQYVRGNIDRSSRYTFLKPGTLDDRPRPAPPGLVNLRFAGDWTKNGVDVPCMEGTVVSALEAAASILGEPADILW